jgi:hypothetical protein
MKDKTKGKEKEQKPGKWTMRTVLYGYMNDDEERKRKRRSAGVCFRVVRAHSSCVLIRVRYQSTPCQQEVPRTTKKTTALVLALRRSCICVVMMIVSASVEGETR